MKCIPSVSHLAHLFDQEDPRPETQLVIGPDMEEAFDVACARNSAPRAHSNLFDWPVVGKFSRSLLPPSSLAYTQCASTQRAFHGSVVKDVNLSATPRFLLRHEAMSDEPNVYEARRR